MSTPVQALTFNLASPIDATQVTIPVRNLKDSRGNSITAMPSGATIIYATIEPRSPANQEIISFTGITNSGSGIVTLTGVTRNLNPQPPYTALTANVPHSNGAECILSNNPPFYNTFAQTDTNATIGAGVVWTFNTNPQKTGSLTATLPAEYVTKSYADSLAIAGAPDATTIQKGISKMSVAGSTVIGTFTVTIATPAVVTLNSHGLIAGDSFTASTTGALPTGMTGGTTYYVIATGLTANNFQFSATYNGTAVNTSGSQSGIHTLTRTSAIAVATEDPRVPTQLENDAMVGQSGNQVGSLNKYEDRFDTTNGTNTDQSQLLQNSIQPVGETDATTKSRKIGQSFIPTQSPIDNVQIYKTADTGTFTGTVTVSIQADTAGSPSGVDLVSTVIGNAAWLALATGLNTVSFASPLNVNPNTTYWLVVTTSTNDTANHPNLGYQNTNAYANGIFKKNNTTDGWSTIATADLTFSINTNTKGKLVRTDSSTGAIPSSLLPAAATKFGGNGSDGALSISSGTTNIDLAGARTVIKQYSSISVTGTGQITFSNPHANGTTVVLLCSGALTVTSSTVPCIDARNIGASGGNGGTNGGNGSGGGSSSLFDLTGYQTNGGGSAAGSGVSGAGATAGSFISTGTTIDNIYIRRYMHLQVGGGGAGGTTQGSPSQGGTGGRGGGVLIIECAGAINFTTTGGISVSGQNGFNGSGSGGSYTAAGGGGGGGGCAIVLYNTATAVSGTITSAGGTGGLSAMVGFSNTQGGGGGGSSFNAGGSGGSVASNGGQSGGNGGAGMSYIGQNTIFL